jgi:agmatine deiminase
MNRSLPATLTPKQLGYRFPAEWEPHEATWLSWPHREDSWPGVFSHIFPSYCQFIKELARSEKVCINVNDLPMQHKAEQLLIESDVDMSRIHFFLHPTNDAWCRDHGPAFMVREGDPPHKVIVSWKFNAWGNKYPHHLDEQIPTRVAEKKGLQYFAPDMVMEGGAVEFNGTGTLLTTKSCLLNPNRNPHLTQSQIEEVLQQYYNVDRILWLEEGISGDDTNGHIDDLTRFVNKDTVVTMIAYNRSHPDYQILQNNAKALHEMELNVLELPMPSLYEEDGFVLPCSYANFYICNAAVIVPTFEDPHDEVALECLTRCFPDRKIVGIRAKELIWGLGTFHCLSQQEPQ